MMQRDIPVELVQQEAVDAVAWAVGENTCRVRTKAGETEFVQPGGAGTDISAKLVAGEDFFGKIDGLCGRTMSPRQWLEATVDTNYPDLPAQILAYFRAKRAGDFAVFAAPGWDFRTANQAGHGGLRGYDDLFTPLLLAGPGVPHQQLSVARTADLVPTILTLLGKPVPAGLDGQSLAPTEKD
jgi:hypothetical protein